MEPFWEALRGMDCGLLPLPCLPGGGARRAECLVVAGLGCGAVGRGIAGCLAAAVLGVGGGGGQLPRSVLHAWVVCSGKDWWARVTWIHRGLAWGAAPLLHGRDAGVFLHGLRGGRGSQGSCADWQKVGVVGSDAAAQLLTGHVAAPQETAMSLMPEGNAAYIG